MTLILIEIQSIVVKLDFTNSSFEVCTKQLCAIFTLEHKYRNSDRFLETFYLPQLGDRYTFLITYIRF